MHPGRILPLAFVVRTIIAGREIDLLAALPQCPGNLEGAQFESAFIVRGAHVAEHKNFQCIHWDLSFFIEALGWLLLVLLPSLRGAPCVACTNSEWPLKQVFR